MVPFAPILEEGQLPFAMFVDLQNKYDWVLDVTAIRRGYPPNAFGEQRDGRTINHEF